MDNQFIIMQGATFLAGTIFGATGLLCVVAVAIWSDSPAAVACASVAVGAGYACQWLVSMAYERQSQALARWTLWLNLGSVLFAISAFILALVASV